MAISLTGRQKDLFQAHLRAHRETFPLNDADYADQVLKISLNTYKKCVEPTDGSLALKRHTLINIFANTALNPKTYGLTIGVSQRDSPFGGYSKLDVAFLCGRFFIYRRSFLTAQHVTRGILEIRSSQRHECLEFHELQCYLSEVGAREELRYQGEIYINRERSLLSLPAYQDGQVRLTLLQPERIGKTKLKMRGALLTFGNPKGHWQPTVSCIFVEGPVEERKADPRDLCKTISKGSDGHDTLAAELARIEEHVTIMTPLMWARLQVQGGDR